MNQLLLYFGIVMLAGFTYLFAPQQITGLSSEATNNNYFRINRLMGFRMNSDSPEFITNAARPASLFEHQAKRQSRPLFILAGSFTGKVIYYLTYPFHSSFLDLVKPKLAAIFPAYHENKAIEYCCIYLGYILINILLMVLSLYCFEEILRSVGSGLHISPILRYALLFFLVSNPLVKYFFWTPHTQVFNILTPLLSVYLAIHIERFTETGRKRTMLMLCSGALLLAYGNFPILFPSIMGSYVYFYFRKKQPGNIAFAVRLMLMTVIYLLPFSAWLMLLSLMEVPVYSSEIADHRQLVWIFDHAILGWKSLLTAVGRHSIFFFQTMGSALVPALFFFISITCTRNSRVSHMGIALKTFSIPLGIAMFSTFLFYWALGYYADRLTVSIGTLLVVLLGILLNSRRTTPAFNILFVVLLVTWHVSQVRFNPTYFTSRFFD